MVKEKLISKKEAILKIDPNSLDTLLHPTLNEKSNIKVIAKGLPASPGAVSGKVVFSSLDKLLHILGIKSYMSRHGFYMVLDRFWLVQFPFMFKFRKL